MDEPVPTPIPETPKPVPNLDPVPGPPASEPLAPPTFPLASPTGANPNPTSNPNIATPTNEPPPPAPAYNDVPVAPAPVASFPASTAPETFEQASPPNFPASGEPSPNLSTATILPVGKGGKEMVSYSSGNKKKFILPLVIGFLLILIAGGSAYFFFTQSGNKTEETPTETPTPTPEPTEEASPTPTPLPSTSYNNTEFNFTIDYPQQWVKKEADLGSVVSFTEQFGTATPAKIKVLAVATTADLKTYVDQSQKIAAQLYPGLIQVSSTDTTQSGNPATMIETTYPSRGGVNIHSLQLIVVKAGQAFTVSGEVEETNFENMRPTLNQVLASFAFTN